jgi:hypothetical protein
MPDYQPEGMIAVEVFNLEFLKYLIQQEWKGNVKFLKGSDYVYDTPNHWG